MEFIAATSRLEEPPLPLPRYPGAASRPAIVERHRERKKHGEYFQSPEGPRPDREMCPRRCTLQVIPPTYRSPPRGILMASLGPCEKQREAFKLQADTLPRTAPRPPPSLALCSPYVFARNFNFNASRCPTQLRTPRCRRCTLIFQKNAHCASFSRSPLPLPPPPSRPSSAPTHSCAFLLSFLVGLLCAPSQK